MPIPDLRPALPGRSSILDGLDAEQREAVLAPRGPVCVLAGAGTGKTRTITRRIAHLVDTGQVNPGQVLAVTFTARAAGEMRTRLRALEIGAAGPGVAAQTFHAAALRQLRYFWPQVFGSARWELLDNKYPVVARAARRSGHDSAPDTVRDLLAEIEWAKASLIAPEDYLAAVERLHRTPPAPGGQVAAVYTAYEDAKVSAEGDRLLDFDDLLIFMTQMIVADPGVAEEFRSRYRSFVVDEYQDVTPVQHGLLNAWVGERDDLTVVGDANQTIYTFTGARAEYLLDFPRRYPDATLIRLVRDYRSTPQVVGLANRVIGSARGRIAGTRLDLVGQRPPGPAPIVADFDDEPAEAAGVAGRITRLLREGVPASEIAILYRVNAQSESHEQALTEAGIPYQVRGGEAFFTRTEVRQAMAQLAAVAERGIRDGVELTTVVAGVLRELGLTETEPTGAQARARWESLSALSALTAEMVAADPAMTSADLVRELRTRAQSRHPPTVQGVTLSSLHAAKGLEWDAVFLVGLTEGALPIGQAIKASPEAVEEERRLFYVGITRARVHLHLSWAAARNEGGRPRQRSRFLAGLGRPRPDASGTPIRSEPAGRPDAALLDALRRWRAERAAADHVRVHAVVTDKTLQVIADRKPADAAALGAIAGIGATKLHKYGDEVLTIVKTAGQK
ncbi:MAG: ATP-dependent helicase [Gordonia sp. (in: high G+C Gram-positive bacteria)]